MDPTKRIGKPKTSSYSSVPKTSESDEGVQEVKKPTPIPLAGSDEPVDPTFQVTSHRVEYVESQSPINTLPVQQALALQASKSKTHSDILKLSRTTEDEKLKHRLAAVLLGKNYPSLAEKVKASGEIVSENSPAAPAA